MSLKRHMLCALLLVASSTAAFAANDGIPNAASGATPDTTQSAVPAPPQTDAPGTRTCRQAKAKSRPQLTAEEKARRKAARQASGETAQPRQPAQGMTHAGKPRQAKLPLC